MNKQKKKQRPIRYGVCLKNHWKVIITYATYEQALNSIKGQESRYEIREIIG